MSRVTEPVAAANPLPGRRRARPPGAPGEGRDNNFDPMRLGLATLVVFSHSYVLPRGGERSEPLMVATGGQMASGDVAVVCFFMISGYLIPRSWERSRGLGDYLGRRALRVYPGFVAASLCCAFVFGPLGDARPREYLGRLDPLRFAYGVVTLRPPLPAFRGLPVAAVNGALWSVFYEFACYLLVAGLGLSGVLRRRRLVAALFAAVLALSVAQDRFGFRAPGVGLWPRVTAAFLSGVVLYLYRDRVALRPGYFAAAVAWLVAAAAAGPVRLLPASVPLAGSYALLYLAYHPAPRLRALTRGSDLSYGIYLYSFPVQQLMVRYTDARIPPLVLFVLGWLASAAAASLSWSYVERPFLGLKRRRPVGEPAASASELDQGRGLPGPRVPGAGQSVSL